MYSAIFLTLILALKGTTDFKKITMTCSSVIYSYTTDGKPGVYLVAEKDYLTEFKTLDELTLELKKQCPTK